MAFSGGGFWFPSLFGVGIGIESFTFSDYEEREGAVTTIFHEV